MASIIEGYNYDIFISYRQKDNKGDRWVSEFVDALKDELESTFKEEISVYFDINPHDGLLETHSVDKSLEDKLKCLIFIPIISRTYCDPKSFAWQHEFVAFNKLVKEDQFGRDVKLVSGNVASRILPVKIHDLDLEDRTLLENELGGVLRGIEFIYKSSGINRPLRSTEDKPKENLNNTIYRDQINKVALAIKDTIEGLKTTLYTDQDLDKKIKIKRRTEKPELVIDKLVENEEIKAKPQVTPRGSEKVKKKLPHRSFQIIAGITVLIILSFSAIKISDIIKKRQYTRYELIPEIQRMVEDNFTAPFDAFELAAEAHKVIPNDSILISLWSKISENISMRTQPEGASVSIKDYDRPADSWEEVGLTPFKNVRVPLGYKRIKIEKEGFQTIFLTRFTLLDLSQSLKLDSIGSLPAGMVRVPPQVARMRIVGLEHFEGKNVGEFFVDQNEVTNEEYKKFIDAGGYEDNSYWNYPIYVDGNEISWETAMNLFIDKTGKHGPASWEVGSYPDGKGNHPVTGVSWYEASAYAAYAGKRLPTIYHWSVITETNRGMNIIPLSNYNRSSTVPVGTTEGVSSYGIYDLAGNVREWCFNGNGVSGESYILGGGWNDPTYSFNEAGAQPCNDRSLSNGFRCIVQLPGDTTMNSLSGSALRAFRDYTKEMPVDDKTFNIFLRQYEYDNTPLDAQLVAAIDTGFWKIEKYSLNASYNNERLILYLYFPLDKQPPYQPIVIFPGSNVILFDMQTSNYAMRVDFLVKSGRVLVFPVLKGTYERKDELKSSNPEETVFYKDHVIMWRKDIGRAIDYLETRKDMDLDKIGYFGYSWGGRMGGLYPAIEKRLKAIVLHVGGMGMYKAFPEVDPLNFITRINQPVLMLNGEYDMYFPVETSQIPMFNFLGTPPADKKIIIYKTGHLVPRTELMKETLSWYDKYLGPVK